MKIIVQENITTAIEIEKKTTELFIYDFITGAGAINYSLIEAKGDLIAGTSAGNASVKHAGANGYLLSYDDTQPTGLLAIPQKTLAGVSPIVTTLLGDIWTIAVTMALAQLSDLNLTGLSDRDVLSYDVSTGKWIPRNETSIVIGDWPQQRRSTLGDVTVAAGYCLIISTDFEIRSGEALIINSNGIMEVL